MAELRKGKVFIEVSDTPVTSTVVRSGRPVPVAKVNRAQAEEWVGRIIAEDPREIAHVVQQSIVAGSVVPKGTVVDLVLAPVGQVPVSIFANAHSDLAEFGVYDLLESDPLQDADVVDILTRRTGADELSAEERRVVEGALRRLEIEIDDATPGRSFEAAYDTARNALSFKV
ncbi:MAG: hypothetical protein H6701_00870 [Myxococcales bacterium]|nr:hypothetical protein [Myxococcales bacterium]MCB9550345.1 hypothetical protein [Myxococcales bacterium]